MGEAMSRESKDEYAADGRLLNGYDYVVQAWVLDGHYEPCGHTTPCRCYGKRHAGEATKAPICAPGCSRAPREA